MANGQAQLPSPLEGECLEQYLRRLSDVELESIRNNSELLRRFCSILLEHFRDFERTEDALENLWEIIERANNLDSLLFFIRRLERARERLLESLAQSENELQRSHTLTNVGRLLGSAVDVAGTVGGLWMMESHPSYANWAFRAATSFGLLGIASTFSEMRISQNTLHDLMRLIEYDQEMIAPIQRWYQQTEELETAMQTVFPFDVTSHIVAEFSDASNTEVTPVRLMAALIRSIAEQDSRRLRDEGLIRNLIHFSSYPGSQDWCEWIVLRGHPVILDITRIVVQLQSSSPLRFAVGQSIPALALADQSISSFPVWGRIGLNLLSIADAVRSLRSTRIPVIVNEMAHLRRHLRAELAALQRIAKFVASRRNREEGQE